MWMVFYEDKFNLVLQIDNLLNQIGDIGEDDHFYKQTREDSAKQVGNSESMWTTNNSCFLALSARLSAFEFWVRDKWMSSEL